MSELLRTATFLTVLALLVTPAFNTAFNTTAAAAEPQDPVSVGASTPTSVVLDGPSPRKSGHSVPLAVRLSTRAGGFAAPVVVQRRVGGDWRRIASARTDAQGRAVVVASMRRRPADNVFRARYAGDATRAASTSRPARVSLVRRASVLRLRGPGRVVDERRVAIGVVWRTGDGIPVAGRVRLFQRVGGAWRLRKVLRTGPRGRASARVRPRRDSVWRAIGRGQPWVHGATSRRHRIDNLPPGNPVRLPAGAPRPRVKLPAQRRATGSGPAATVSRIPQRVWRNMVGRSWHSGCPVGRAGLRLIRINYWDYSGYRRRGEMVVAAPAAGNVVGALSEMYRRRYPIRSMYRVDRFGWSSRLGGANDYRSMAAGNTSAFNCRNVVNRPGVRSPHSYGGSVDVNPWENPYRSATGLVPNSWWHSRTHPRVAWRSSRHPVVRIMRSHGLRWTYGTGDSHHFDAAVHGRLVSPRCVGICH